MVILDANILIYGRNVDAVEHKICFAWLEGTTKQGTGIGLPWVSILAFLRVATNPRLFAKPLSRAIAVEHIASLLANENYSIVEADRESFTIFAGACEQVSVTPKLFTDAYLASLAIQHHATLVSADFDFARFVPLGLKWLNPVAGTGKK